MADLTTSSAVDNFLTKTTKATMRGAMDAATGPGTSTAHNLAAFASTDGQTLEDSGAVALNGVASSAGAGDSGKVPLLNGSGLLDSTFLANTGTGSFVRVTSPTLVTPALGTPSAVVLTNATAVPAAQIVGVIPVANLATGTPTGSKFIRDDGTLQSIPGGGDALTSNPLSQFASTTSAQLAAVISNETGSGALVFATSPTLVTPVLGTPASGNLSACTADGTNVVGFREIPQNSKSAAYTTVLSDSGKHILHPSADTTARTFTIDSNANVAYPIGTPITFINQHLGGVITIAITSDTMRLAGAGTTGSRTLAADGVATAIKITSTEWIISGTGLT